MSPSVSNPPRPGGGFLFWVPYAATLAVLQAAVAGYRFGMANQSIQLPFLLHLRDPSLFAADAILASLPSYPGVLLPVLARLIPPGTAVEPVFLLLHLVTACTALAAAGWLGAGLCGRRGSGFLLMLLLAAGHHAGLSESGLYAMGFSHTWVGYALGVLALALAVNGRVRGAFVLAGLLLHVHALLGGFVGLMLGAWSLAALPRIGWRRMAQAWVLGLLAAASALVPLLAGAPELDAEWIRLVRIRSAHHVFPTAWWRAGDARIPRLGLVAGFAALAWGLRPPARRREARNLIAVPLILAVLGTVFSEMLPVPAVIRAQLFRATGFLVLLLLAAAANGLCRGWLLALATVRLRGWRGIPVAVAAGAVVLLAGLVLAVPAAAGLQVPILVGSAAVLLAFGRLPSAAAALAGGFLVLAAAAHAAIQVPLVTWPGVGLLSPAPRIDVVGPLLPVAVLGIGLAGLLQRTGRWRTSAVFGLLLAGWIGVELAAAGAYAVDGDRPWIDIQRAARRMTPRDAVVLTPTVPDGFRIHSHRAVVAEWRDGTQQFFDPAFARVWWQRMERIRLGLVYSEDGRRILQRGGDLADLPEEEILSIAGETGASHVVLPVARRAGLDALYANDRWVLYHARPAPPPPAPEGFADEAAWAAQQEFLRDVVAPNIERHRTSEVALHLSDAGGRPLADRPFRLRQVDSLFRFGSALEHFLPPPGRTRGFDPGLVDERQLDRFREIFNFSVIGFSGKWDAIEPVRGEPDYRALDAYIDWCVEHGIAVEYHFVSGYPPAWLRELDAQEQRDALRRHAGALIDRYGDRIASWQVVNERHLVRESPDVIRLFRERLPDAPLGTSDCARWHTGRDRGRRGGDLLRGMAEVQWLVEQGTPVDFFGFHGHRPFGLWADARVMYETFDAFDAAGVRVHISEFGVHRDGPIHGDLRTGTWDAELQAEYYRQVFTVAFSHPAVDAINFWGMGPRTWISGAGLLDEAYEPLPAFEALKDLVMREWRTEIDGRVPLDGRVRFRGYHGRYRVEVTGEDGILAGEFEVRPGGANDIRLHRGPGEPRLLLRPSGVGQSEPLELLGRRIVGPHRPRQ